MKLEVTGRRGRLISPFIYQQFPDIEEAMEAHAGNPRFNAHGSLGVEDYSVLHHVVVIGVRLFNLNDAPEAFLAGLCHEFDELWLGDIPGPTKALLREFAPSFFAELGRGVKRNLDFLLGERFRWFNLERFQTVDTLQVKRLDNDSRWVEFREQFFVHDPNDPGRLESARSVWQSHFEKPPSGAQALEDTTLNVMDFGPSAVLLGRIKLILRDLDRAKNRDDAHEAIAPFALEMAAPRQ